MEIKPDSIISAESYEKFGVNHTRRDTNLRVQGFINDGLMSQDSVYRRYAGYLQHQNAASSRGANWTTRQRFSQLCDPKTGYLSRKKFKEMFEEALPTASPDVPALLLDIFIWNAFFPFPPTYDSSGELCIDEEAFTRAVNQLVWNHSPRHSTGMWTRAYHNVMTGNWGPYAGWLVSTRGRDSNDYTRWLFRSLAIPNDTTSGYETTILVPRFFIDRPRREERSPEADSEDEAPEQQVVIVEKENERTIDIQDILSEHAPSNYAMVGDPLREGYKLALPHLPHHQHDLSDLHVPAANVLSLLTLLNEYDGPPEIKIVWEEQDDGDNNGGDDDDDDDEDIVAELIAATKRLGNEGFSWEAFDDMLNEHAELIADTLAQVFLVLKDPRNGIDESASQYGGFERW